MRKSIIRTFENFEQPDTTVNIGTTKYQNLDGYSEKVDKTIPMWRDSEVRSVASELTRKFNYDPDPIIALCYNMLTDINEHDLVIDFVGLLDKVEMDGPLEEKKKIPAGLQAYLDKKKKKGAAGKEDPKKTEDKKTSKKESPVCDKKK